MTTPVPLTLPEVDLAITNASRAYIAARLARDATTIATTRADLDGLIARRLELTSAVP